LTLIQRLNIFKTETINQKILLWKRQKKPENIVPKNLFPEPNPIDWNRFVEPKKVVLVKINSVITVTNLVSLK